MPAGSCSPVWPAPGTHGGLPRGRGRVAAGRPACQRAAHVLRYATALRVTPRPPRGSDGSYGPCGPAWTGRPGRPRRSRDAADRRTGNAVSGLQPVSARPTAPGGNRRTNHRRRSTYAVSLEVSFPCRQLETSSAVVCSFQLPEVCSFRLLLTRGACSGVRRRARPAMPAWRKDHFGMNRICSRRLTAAPCRKRAAVVAAVLLAALAASDAVGQPSGLFRPVELAAATVDPRLPTLSDILTLRRRLVSIDFGQLAQTSDSPTAGSGFATARSGVLTLNLFDDASFTGLVERVAPTFSGGYALSGRLAGVEMGTMTLVVNGDVVAGTVRTPEATYRIRPSRGGLHTISQIDPARLPPLAEPLTRRPRDGYRPLIDADGGSPTPRQTVPRGR